MGSLDDDDPNILLAIQLSLQDSGLAGSGSNSDGIAGEASLGAIGTSLPSRLDQGPSVVDVLHRASLSSSELLELGDSLARLGAVNACSQYSAAASVATSAQHWTHKASAPIPVAPGGSTSSTGIFSSSSDTIDSADQHSASAAAGANANLLGNIMAWFHDMNPQGVTLVPSASSDTDSDLVGLDGGGDGGKSHPAMTDHSQFHCPVQPAAEEKERPAPDRPTQLDLAGLEGVARPYVAALEGGSDGGERAKAAKVCHVDTPGCDSVSDQLPSTSSSEWEDQVHLV